LLSELSVLIQKDEQTSLRYKPETKPERLLSVPLFVKKLILIY